MNARWTRSQRLGCAKSVVRRALRSLGFELVRRRPGLDLTKVLAELDDHRAFRAAAEAEIRELKERAESREDQLRVQQNYLSALTSIIASQETATARMAGAISMRMDSGRNLEYATAVSPPGAGYASCPWIEGGVSFIPGRLRVCPNTNIRGGTPGLVPFSEGPLPVKDILARRDLIRRANRLGCFEPCTSCAFRVTRSWETRPYAFDLLCIAHATACNLACGYCHSIPEARYLQNPKSVPRLYPTIAALIADGHLAPGARVQWGGGEPTILREFDALFGLLGRHRAYSEVYSSGVRVPEVLLDGMAQDRAGVMISLDAGTPETYARTKGRAVFDRVVANVARYARVNPGRTILKMIVSEMNLGEVLQFLDVAERAGVRIVCHDTMMYRDRADDRVIEAVARFRAESARRGLECRMGEVGSVYNPDDRVAQRVDSMSAALAATPAVCGTV